jgi:maleylpyruvate isomerase
LTTAAAWMQQGTKLFLTALSGVPDAGLDQPSGLPGWSRRHVVAHVHFNAEALRRLVGWAATGIENPMYSSPGQRAAEIEHGAATSAPQLRRLVADSAGRLAEELLALPAGAWDAEVVTAQGRRVPASDIPWLRTREVTVHAIDLRAGATLADLPDDLTEALLFDVVRRRTSRGEGAALATWLTGRSTEPSALGPWL